MPSRKRAADDMAPEESVEEASTLQKLRNMWQFANLAQYISLFGEVHPTCARRHADCAGHDSDGTLTDKLTGVGI
jgi:hypothetical protein